MAMYFDEKFKRLRKSHDLTQEEISEIFHVSPQTVSRWETGVNYPDIDLLPHIAGFFQVTVDELLGTDLILGEQKAKEYQRDIRKLLNSGKVRDAIETARKAVENYPVNYDLQGHLLQALCTEPDKKRKDEIIATGERIINYCTDQQTCLWAKHQLIRQYIKWGMKEEAKKIVYSLPSEAYFTQDLNLSSILEGDEWIQNQKLRIVRFTIMLCDLIRGYASKAGLDIAQKIEWLKAAAQIENLTRPIQDDNGEMTVHLDCAFQNITFAELYCEAGDVEKALDCIEKATRDSMYHIDVMAKTNEDGSNYFAWSTPRNLCWVLWEDFLVKTQFDIVRNNERFIKCFELLKSNSHEIMG